jgi:hypothetical protein
VTGLRPLPWFATLVLQRLDADDAMIGDLGEEYRAGRSRWWYWRQVVSAVAAATATGKWRVAAGVAFAIALQFVIGFPSADFMNLLNLWLTPHVPLWFLDYNLHDIWAVAFEFTVYHLVGIIITGVNRRQAVPVLSIFVAYLVFLHFRGIPYQASLSSHHLAVYLARQMPRMAGQIAGVLVGGLGFWASERHAA